MSTTTTPVYQEPPPLIYQQQQQQQPVAQQSSTSHASHGSAGPVIAVLAVITILGVIAAMIGRLCSGRRIMGHGHYDCESWVETKCSSCIDGRVEPSTMRRPTMVAVESSSCSEEVASAEESREVKVEQYELGTSEPKQGS